MAFADNNKKLSGIAAADLSAAQYLFIKLDSTGKVAVCGDGQKANGVLYEYASAADRAVAYAIDGIAKVKAGGNITAGAQVASDASGKAVTAASGDVVLGVARTAGVNNDVISVQLSL